MPPLRWPGDPGDMPGRASARDANGGRHECRPYATPADRSGLAFRVDRSQSILTLPPWPATPGGRLDDHREDCPMPRPYEVMYIFDSALEDAAITEKLTRFHNMLGAHGAPPADLKVDTWGRRQLA